VAEHGISFVDNYCIYIYIYIYIYGYIYCMAGREELEAVAQEHGVSLGWEGVVGEGGEGGVAREGADTGSVNEDGVRGRVGGWGGTAGSKEVVGLGGAMEGGKKKLEGEKKKLDNLVTATSILKLVVRLIEEEEEEELDGDWEGDWEGEGGGKGEGEGRCASRPPLSVDWIQV
jgi:hypothetical protein